MTKFTYEVCYPAGDGYVIESERELTPDEAWGRAAEVGLLRSLGAPLAILCRVTVSYPLTQVRHGTIILTRERWDLLPNEVREEHPTGDRFVRLSAEPTDGEAVWWRVVLKNEGVAP